VSGPAIVKVTIGICDLCLGGREGECHSPGCVFWMCPAITAEQAEQLRDRSFRGGSKGGWQGEVSVVEPHAAPGPRTVWRLCRLPGLHPLDVTVTVDTTAPVVLMAIERAAGENGITLVRVEEDVPG